MRKQASCLEKEIMQGTMTGARRRGRQWTGHSVEESIRMTEEKQSQLLFQTSSHACSNAIRIFFANIAKSVLGPKSQMLVYTSQHTNGNELEFLTGVFQCDCSRARTAVYTQKFSSVHMLCRDRSFMQLKLPILI